MDGSFKSGDVLVVDVVVVEVVVVVSSSSCCCFNSRIEQNGDNLRKGSKTNHWTFFFIREQEQEQEQEKRGPNLGTRKRGEKVVKKEGVTEKEGDIESNRNWLKILLPSSCSLSFSFSSSSS
jgi:hypothetical protein